jgi:hypothetical protein
MKKRDFLVGLLVVLCTGLGAQELKLDEVLTKYYEAGNFEKLTQVGTIVMTGTIVQQDLMPVKIVKARAARYLMEYDVADLTAYQGFDGEQAWYTAPWTGNAAPQIATPDKATDLKVRADFDGILYDWKQKGHSLELDGTDTVNGLTAYKIKVVRKDGGTEYNLIDNKGFLLQKRISFRQLGGKEVKVESTYHEYRKVEGIPFPFRVETNTGGRVNEIQFDSVAVDIPVNLMIFLMPGQ